MSSIPESAIRVRSFLDNGDQHLRLYYIPGGSGFDPWPISRCKRTIVRIGTSVSYVTFGGVVFWRAGQKVLW